MSEKSHKFMQETTSKKLFNFFFYGGIAFLAINLLVKSVLVIPSLDNANLTMWQIDFYEMLSVVIASIIVFIPIVIFFTVIKLIFVRKLPTKPQLNSVGTIAFFLASLWLFVVMVNAIIQDFITL
jgi:phosphoglycerol transferase MdoB-like AlkP superfamily enzyme